MINSPDLNFRYVPKKEPISYKKVVSDRNYKHRYTHMHDNAELALITTESVANIFNNGNSQKIHTPALILHRSGTYHCVDTTEIGDQGYSCFCIFFDEQYIKQIPEKLLRSDLWLKDDCLIMELKDEEVKKLTPYVTLMEESDSSAKKKLFLLLLILDEMKNSIPAERHIRLSNPNHYIFDVAHYLIDHFDESFTTGQIAAAFHVSVSKINADFHKVTGETLKSFCTNLRLSRAVEMLTTTDEPILEVAYRCGFASESYFIQAFQREFSTTPSVYRKNNRKN